MSLELAVDASSRLLLEKARNGILGFTLATKPDYQIGWHHRELAKKINAWVRGDIKFLMVFMPPRHGKSELVSRRLPAFLHGKYPDCEIMAASYLDSLAGDMTTDVQNIIDCPAYKTIFPQTRIWPPGSSYTKGMRNSSEHHIMYRRGKYRGQGVGGSFTGKGANFIIIDDPIKGREIADSATFRDRLWNFYINDLFSRLETDLVTGRSGQILITQTRWHEDDLSGRLLNLMKDNPGAVQWDVVNYPAIREDLDEPSDTRKIGDALWPEKFDLAHLMQIKESSGDRAWASVYQQSPMPAGGSLFTEEMFVYVDLPEKFDYTFIMADTAYKDKQDNDYTVFTAFGVANAKIPELFIIDVWRKRIKAAEIEKPAIDFIKQYQEYGFRGAYIEPKGHGIYLNQSLPKSGISIPSESRLEKFFDDRRVDKVERANNIIPRLSNKKVHINRKLNNKEELVREALNFPNGKHDDFVDTLIDGVKFVFARKLSILDVI